MEIIDIVKGEAIIGKDTKLGLVHLKVKSLEAQVSFYTLVLKMTLIEKTEDYAILGDKQLTPLLYLKKKDGLKRYNDTSGLYHFALLYPNEKELAKAIAWLIHINYQNAPTDHGYSKTTYLRDYEGNDIELYIRTPERARYIMYNGQPKMQYNDGRITDARDELDLNELFSHLTKDDIIDTPLEHMVMGHVHLYGYNLDKMQDFYTNVVGFAGGQYLPYFRMSDVSLSRKEYHVVAFNSWKNTNKKAPDDALGLDYYTIVMGNKEDYEALITRLTKANVKLIEEEGELYVLDPSQIKFKIERNF